MIPVGAMPLPTVTEAGAAAPTARRLEDVGEVIPVSAHDPFLANDTDSVWIVVTGGILLFTVALENGQPVGTRSHFLGINTGQCFFGIDALSVGSGFPGRGEAGHDGAQAERARSFRKWPPIRRKRPRLPPWWTPGCWAFRRRSFTVCP